MILLENYNGLLAIILAIYIVCHLPAIIMLIVAYNYRKKDSKTSTILVILAIVYFIIGFGVCGGMFG